MTGACKDVVLVMKGMLVIRMWFLQNRNAKVREAFPNVLCALRERHFRRRLTTPLVRKSLTMQVDGWPMRRVRQKCMGVVECATYLRIWLRLKVDWNGEIEFI